MTDGQMTDSPPPSHPATAGTQVADGQALAAPPGWTGVARPLGYVVHLLALLVLVRLGAAEYGAWHALSASTSKLSAGDKLLFGATQSSEVDLLLVLAVAMLATIAVLARLDRQPSEDGEQDRWAAVDVLRAGGRAGLSLALASGVVLVLFVIAMVVSNSPGRQLVDNSAVATVGFLVQPAVVGLITFGLALALVRHLRAAAAREQKVAEAALAQAQTPPPTMAPGEPTTVGPPAVPAAPAGQLPEAVQPAGPPAETAQDPHR